MIHFAIDGETVLCCSVKNILKNHLNIHFRAPRKVVVAKSVCLCVRESECVPTYYVVRAEVCMYVFRGHHWIRQMDRRKFHLIKILKLFLILSDIYGII